jgi:protein TonB
MPDAKRHSFSWLSSIALHAAALSAMSCVVTVVPMQISLQHGRNAIELQASMAAAPQAEPEPVPIEVEKTETVEETKPVQVVAQDVTIEKQTGKPELLKKPEATEPESKVADADEIALAKAELKPIETPSETEPPPPPKRKLAEAKVDLPDAPVMSSAAAASKAESGVDYDEAPLPRFNPKPPYPVDALARREEGRVWLRLRILVDGTVGEVEIVESSGFNSLDLAAVETVRDWRFTPARRGGESVAAVCRLPINFRL